MASDIYVAYCIPHYKISKQFDLFKPLPGNGEPVLREDDTEQDQSGGKDSVSEAECLSDAAFDIVDDEEQLATWKEIELCCVMNDDYKSVRRKGQAVCCDAGVAGCNGEDGHYMQMAE